MPLAEGLERPFHIIKRNEYVNHWLLADVGSPFQKEAEGGEK